MVVEEEKKAPQTQLELFAENLPHKPYCSDSKGALQIRKNQQPSIVGTSNTTSRAYAIGLCTTTTEQGHLTTSARTSYPFLTSWPRTQPMETATFFTGLLTLFAQATSPVKNPCTSLQKLTMCCAKN